MLSLEITYCSMDDHPIEESPAYRLLLLCGEDVASLFTYTETATIIPEHPPPGSEQHEHLAMVGRPR